MLGRRISLTYTPPPVRKRLVLCGLMLRPTNGVESSAIQSYLPARPRSLAVTTHRSLSSEIPLNPPFSKGEVIKIGTKEKKSRAHQLQLYLPLFEKEGHGEICLNRRTTSLL